MPAKRPAIGAGWLTLVDTVFVLTAAAALVVALGVQGRLTVAGTLITIRSPLNLTLAALVLAAVRAGLGGRTRLFPAIPLPDRAPFEAERARFASPEPWTRHTALCAAAAVAGSLVWIAPHILHPRMVPDAGDPLFSAWRVARIAHQLTHDPRHLFDGNIFYPLPLTLTLSDATFLQAMLGAPFILLGADPLLVANALTMIAFPLCGLAFFIAGWRLTGDPYAGIVAGLAGAWYPFHAEHYSHLELHWVMFAPLALVTGMRLLADPRPLTGLRFGAAIALQWLASMYLGVMLMSFLAPFLLVVALGWRVAPSRRLLTAIGTAVVVALPAFAVLGVPFMTARGIRGDRGLQEVRDGSAVPLDYGHAHIRLSTYRWQDGSHHKVERELFPGTSTLALAAGGALPPLTAGTTAALVAGSLAFDWSLGLNGLTYGELYRLSPVYRGMRVMARFSAIVGVALVLLGAAGSARLLRRVSGRARPYACATLALLVLFDLRMDPRIGPIPNGIPPIYSRVTPDMVLVELPVDPQISYMYFSTFHWAQLVGGYSGFPKYSDALMDGWKRWPSPESLADFRRTGATHLTYNCGMEEYKQHCAAAFETLDNAPGLELMASGLWQGQEARLYRFR
jgi:hypothetical protein